MLGVGTNPTMTPSDVAMKQVAEEMGVGDTFQLTPVGVFFGGARRPRGEAGPRPLLRRRRTGPQRLHRVRRVHDRLPARREEHPDQELPPPRREGRRGRPPDDHRHRAYGRAPGRVRGHAGATRPSCRGAGPRAFTADQVVFSAAALGTQTLLHRLKADGDAAPDLRPARRADPHQLRGAPRRAHRRPPSTSPGASRSPRRSTPTSTPTSSRSATATARNVMGLLQTVLADDGPGESRVAHGAQGAVGRAAHRLRPLAPGAGRSARSSPWSCSRWTTRSRPSA